MTLPSVRFCALAAAALIAFLATAPAIAQGDDLQEVNQLFKQGQYDRAFDRVEAYLKSRPKDARGRFLKGVILTEQNKPGDAIKVFTELTQDFPELPEPYNNLAVLYASQGEYDKARSALEMAIRTHPSYATAHENLGDIYAKMASTAYDKALQLDRGNMTAQTKLNLIRELFSSSPRPPKAAASKPEPATKVATATPVTRTAPPPPPAAKASEPAAKSGPVKGPVKPAAARNPDEVLKVVNGWAKAWSDNDVAGYLAHYAPDFQTPKGEARGDWEAQRKARIAKPRKIQVSIESPKVTFGENDRATVTFRQHYRSETLKVSGIKTLVMMKAGDKWLIQQEKIGG
ncbi:MAG: tetratricopeptide repeat protein [Betaproteobacteria bacterium]|nr:tetratricopeptide repeat protein [Betaproteobacteria bacterium]